jgi:hypothetical protein
LRRLVLTAIPVVLAVIVLVVWATVSTTDRGDDARETAMSGPATASCSLPRFGFVTCQREVVKRDTQRLEASVSATGDRTIVIRANGGEHGPASLRRMQPGETRILVNAGAEDTYAIQARTSAFSLTPAAPEINVQVVDQ